MPRIKKQRRTRKPKLDRVIARRTIDEYTGDAILPTEISIGAPHPDDDGNWKCPILIDGRDDSGVEYIFGVDAFQALLLALLRIRQRLDNSGSAFKWLGMPGSGIPKQVPVDYGRGLEDRVDALIERETTRHWRSVLKEQKTKLADFEAALMRRKKTVASWEALLKKRKTIFADFEVRVNRSAKPAKR